MRKVESIYEHCHRHGITMVSKTGYFRHNNKIYSILIDVKHVSSVIRSEDLTSSRKICVHEELEKVALMGNAQFQVWARAVAYS